LSTPAYFLNAVKRRGRGTIEIEQFRTEERFYQSRKTDQTETKKGDEKGLRRLLGHQIKKKD